MRKDILKRIAAMLMCLAMLLSGLAVAEEPAVVKEHDHEAETLTVAEEPGIKLEDVIGNTENAEDKEDASEPEEAPAVEASEDEEEVADEVEETPAEDETDDGLAVPENDETEEDAPYKKAPMIIDPPELDEDGIPIPDTICKHPAASLKAYKEVNYVTISATAKTHVVGTQTITGTKCEKCGYFTEYNVGEVVPGKAEAHTWVKCYDTVYDEEEGEDKEVLVGAYCSVCRTECEHPNATATAQERVEDNYGQPVNGEKHEVSVSTRRTISCPDCGATIKEYFFVGYVEKPHIDEDEDGMCDVCDYTAEEAADHEHVWITSSWVSEYLTYKADGEKCIASNAIIGHSKNCRECDEYFIWHMTDANLTEVRSHYYSGGVCMECGAVAPVVDCKHPNVVFDESYSDDIIIGEKYTADKYGTHRITVRSVKYYWCMDCGKRIDRVESVETIVEACEDWAPADGKCDECGAAVKATECEEGKHAFVDFDSETGTSYDARTFTPNKDGKTHHVEGKSEIVKRVVCTVCGAVDALSETVPGAAVSYDEAHDYWDGPVCYECGYVNTCKHPNAKAREAEAAEELYYWHSDVAEGVGYQKVDGKTHKVISQTLMVVECPDCDYTYAYVRPASSKVFGTEAHSWYEGRCNLCGAYNLCKHEGATYERSARHDYWAGAWNNDEKAHTGKYAQFIETVCSDCGQVVDSRFNKIFDGTEAHIWIEDTLRKVKYCYICGYVEEIEEEVKKPETSTSTSNKKDKDSKDETASTEPVFTEIAKGTTVHGVIVGGDMRMGIAMATAIKNMLLEYGAGIEISYQHVEDILTAEELAALEQLPPVEQIMVILSVLGYEDEVANALEELPMALSDAATALIEKVADRLANATDAERKAFELAKAMYFPVTKATIDGVEADHFEITLEIKASTLTETRLERYGFDMVDGAWLFHKLEVASVAE